MIDLYEGDTGKASGLAMLPKLKYEHIHLNSFSKMRVDLAAQVSTTRINIIQNSMYMYIKMQVLSESVSKALTLTGGEKTQETAKFTSYLDRFFDSLNVSNFCNGKKQRKPFQDPYRSSSDFRLNVSSTPRLVYLKISRNVCTHT